MKNRTATLIAFGLMFSVAAHPQTPNLEEVKWQQGPSIGNLSGTAEVRVPAGYVFAGANDTRVLMEAMQNPTSGNEMGFIAPAGLDWFVVFEFDDVGYVRDDEKNSLDADAMLESIKKGTEAGNKERRRRGWPLMTILGWERTPRYNETTHNLEWAIRGESEGYLVINYNTRLLGRGGVMRVTLVTDPTTLSPTLPKFKNLLAGFDFKQGQKYAEFRQGDKVAKYGLTALVVGGASAVAVKTGMFKWIWKGLVVGFLALAAFLKSLFSRKKSQ
ncbi:MAG: DUF2167 domain-containing protein [Deltaproteobacteria bacterium]|nr:DUF2167 domain-containing protein [Deltaproteobacteria bacterium]